MKKVLLHIPDPEMNRNFHCMLDADFLVEDVSSPEELARYTRGQITAIIIYRDAQDWREWLTGAIRAGIKAIVVTNRFNTVDNARESLALGADQYVVLPVAQQVLVFNLSKSSAH